MESINHIDAASQQQKQQYPIMTAEGNSAAAPMSSKKAIAIASSDIILPDDGDTVHSRHTFSSRQKMQEAAARKRNKSGGNNKQQRSKNNNSVGIVSPLADGTNVRQGDSRTCNNNDSGNSDMKWSTIGKKKLTGTQELDKLASLIPQPISPECSVEEIEEEDYEQQIVMSAVSPDASSPTSLCSHQQKQLPYSNFKTPKKTPTSLYQNIDEASSIEETPITELFNYYNFPNNSSSKEHNKSMSPTTSNMLQTSPFRTSSKLLDDQLQSVLEADRNMDRKIEQMEKDLDDSYMGSPMSGSLNGGCCVGGGDNDSSSDDDDNFNDEGKDKLRSDSMSTISDAISEISHEGDASYRHHLQSPDVKSDAEFLTPRSRLVIKTRGQRTVGTAYFTARNAVDGDDNTMEGKGESRMYDSDSESYSVRRIDVLQQQQQRPRSASYDAVSSHVAINRDVNTITHAVLEKVRRNSMSPPAEFRTTRVLWRDDTTPMRLASLNWEFDAEEKIPNKGVLTGGKRKKSINATKSQTPLSCPVKQHYDVDGSAHHAISTPSVTKELHDRASLKKKDTVSHACTLHLGRISEEQMSESIQSDSEVFSDRNQLLNVINSMRIQLTQLEGERDSLVAERDVQVKDCNEYKMEKEALSSRVKTLEEEVQISLQVVGNVKETLSSKTAETDCLKQLLRKRDDDLDILKASLLIKEGKVEELSLALKGKEGNFEARLQAAEKEKLAEVVRVTAEVRQEHSEAIDRLESNLKEAHANELDLTTATLAEDFEQKSSELMAAHSAQMEQMKLSSSEEVARVRREAEKEHLAAIDAITLNHTQEIASIVERLNASRSEAIDDLKAAHKEEVKLLQDGSYELNAKAEKLSKENDDLTTQISLLKEANEGLGKTLSTQEEEQRQSLEAAREREISSTDRYNEVDAILQESNASLALVREENKVLGETVANLTKSLEAKHTDLECAVQKSDDIQTEMKRQLLDSQTEIDSMTLAKIELESKYAALIEENASLKESNSTLNEANETLQASLGEVSDNLSVVTKEREELIASLGDATSNMKKMENRIASVDSELEIEIRHNEELSKEIRDASQRENEHSTQIKCLQSDVTSANEEKVAMAAELDALACLERDIREQLETSEDEKTSLQEETTKLQSHLFEAKSDKDSLSRELEEMSLNNQSNETRISELESEIRALSRVKNILQLKSDKIESLNASATVERDEGNKKMARLREVNDVINAELVQVKSELQYESEKAASVIAEKSNVEAQLKSTQSERYSLQRELDEALISCETMLLTLENARLQIQLKSDEIESLNTSSTAKLNEVHKKIDFLREEHVATKAELEEMQSQLQSASANMADVLSAKSRMEVKLNATQQERNDLQQKFDEAVVSCESMLLTLEDSRIKMKLQSNEMNSLNASSAAELIEMNNKFHILIEENTATNAALESLQSEKASVEVQLNATQEERDDLQQRYDEAVVSLEDARTQNQDQSSKIELLNASAASGRAEVSKKMDDLQHEKSGVVMQLKATRQEHDNLREKFDEAVVSCESMLLSLEDARSQIQAQTSEMELLNASVEAERTEGSKMMDALREEKSGVETQLKANQKDRDDLQEKFNEAVVSCESMLLTLEDARSQIQKQSIEIESLNTCAASEGEEVSKKLDMLREENAATNAALELLRSEKSIMEVQLNATQEERDDLQQRLDEAVVSLEDARTQSQDQSSKIELLNASAASGRAEVDKMIDALREETSGVEMQLKATRQEHDDLREKFDEAVVSCESMLLSLEDARSHKLQLVEMEDQLAEKADAFSCLQAVAAKLAVNVLQLKLRSKNELERNDELTAEIELKNERVTYLEACLDELKRDSVVEQNLKSTVARLALALIKLKARERHALTAQQTLSDNNIELLAKLEVTSKENEGMEEGMSALTDKISALELDSCSNHTAIAELQKAVSEKDSEVKRLSDLLAGKDEAIRDVASEMQTIRSDVMNGVKKLELEHASEMKARAHLEEELKSVNTQLNRERELVFNLQSELEQSISEKNAIQDDFVDLQGTHLHLENRLEQVAHDRSHLRTQIDDMHDSIAALEADKDSLTMKLEEFQEQAERFTTKIAALEANAKSNARQIDYMEFQLVSKMDEAEALNKMVVSHEATMKDLNDEIESLDAKRSETEESVSSLQSMMDIVTSERDGLASQLQSAIEELESVRAEWGQIRSSAGSSVAVTPSPSKVDVSQEVDDFANSSPGQNIRKILESSKISSEDIDFICSSMDRAKTVITEIGKERRLLKKEVKRLRAELEHAQGELTTVKKNCKVMNQQTIALRGDVNQAKSRLKEYEAEKNQLASDLEAAHEAMDQIQSCSSESYKALVQQSQHEISKLKSELESKDEAIDRLQALRNDHISKFDITSDSIQSSQQPTVVTSTERFKVEKGQSMFGILKGKRTKRKGKDQLSYRKRK